MARKKRRNIARIICVGWVMAGLMVSSCPVFATGPGIEVPAIVPPAQQPMMPPAQQIPNAVPMPVINSPSIVAIPASNPAVTIPAPTPAIIHPSGAEIREGQVSIGINPLDPYHQIIQQGTPQAIIDWNTFSIGRGATTEFRQPGSDSVVLNRVTGGFPSDIWGTLKANGHVFLINPAGITIWQGGKVDVAGFTATTANISNQDFLNGKLTGNYPFKQEQLNNPRAVINYGDISIKEGGLAALVGPGAANYGVIRARLSRVVLAEGTEFTLVDTYGDGLIQFATNQPSITAHVKTSDGKAFKHGVSHTGKIEADGGKVVLMTTGAVKNILGEVINTSGVIQANAVKEKNGVVYIYDAGSNARGPDDKGITKVTGRIEARGNKPGEYGGTVIVTGKRLQGGNHIQPKLERELQPDENFSIDVSGHAGPGSILFGGDAHKEKIPQKEAFHQNLPKPTPFTRGNKVYWPEFFRDKKHNNEVPAAEATILGHDLALIADNLHVGSGGKIIVTSDMNHLPDASQLADAASKNPANKAQTPKGLTRKYGALSAKGGKQGGHGGYIQICGDWIDVQGAASAARAEGASFGAPGLIYIDPADVTVTAGANSNGMFVFVGGVQTWTNAAGNNSNVNGPTVQAFLTGGTNVAINTTGAGAAPGVLTYAFDTNAAAATVFLDLNAIDSIDLMNGIIGTGLTLNLSGPFASGGGGAAGIQVLALSIDFTNGCNIGSPPGAVQASVNGVTNGSNVTVANRPIPAGLYFFNGIDLAIYNSTGGGGGGGTTNNNTVVNNLNPSNSNTTGGSPTGTNPPDINNQPPSGSNPIQVTPSTPTPAPAPAPAPAPSPSPSPTPSETTPTPSPTPSPTPTSTPTSEGTPTAPTSPTPSAPPTEGGGGVTPAPVPDAPSATNTIGGGPEGREAPTNAEAAGGREGVAEGAFSNPDAFEKTEATVSTACPANVEGGGSVSKECVQRPLGGPMSQEEIAKALGEDKKAPVSPDGVEGVVPSAIGAGPLAKEEMTNAESAGGDEALFAKSQSEWSIEDINRTPEYLENLGPELPQKRGK